MRCRSIIKKTNIKNVIFQIKVALHEKRAEKGRCGE
ncbi:Uncharacterised protein [Legionella pneumophila]|nr:Uncharacterised protein [Legionella pneumophila]CZH86959.1 Uncharacterised protein [Legionella pneumophila]CZI08281.1 Uncharacterised protein [Legionella pneumophila]CZI28850.1 Uncharacterised protein [Legionella pneumophila]CZM26281.1 Uncharacterised protein [Legionella pneumophila]